MSDEKTEDFTTKGIHTITSTSNISSEGHQKDGQFFRSVAERYTKVDPSSYLRQENESSSKYWFRRLGQIKPVELLWGDAENSELRRVLSAFQLVFVGIGAIIGTGIFVLSGLAAAKNAGPAVTISFLIAAVAAAFAALSYSEMASMIPVAGSAYTYAYATMGEFVAWIIGWDLILEYMVGAATVGVGWSGYFVEFFEIASNGKIIFGENWTKPTLGWTENPASIYRTEGHYFNVPGFVIIMLVTIILCMGIRQSAIFNTVVVTIKLVVILLFIFALCGFMYKPNYDPYIPPNTSGDWHFFGGPGIVAAATTVFFSYIGFDAVTTAALEAKNPQRDLPIGIIGSLSVSTILYIAFCTIMTGAAKYTELNVPTPVLVAVKAVMDRTGKDFRWLNILVALGAICGLTSVLLINLLAQSRVLYSMAQDGLLPSVFAKVHPKFKTPWVTTLTVGFITAVLSAILPVDLLGNMTSVGTLLAFFVVHAGVIVMRFTRPEVERRFKIPGGKYLSLVFPTLGMAVSVALIAVAEVTTIWRLFVWMAIGWVIYFAYSIRHSQFNRDPVGRFAMAHKQLPAHVEHDENGYQVQQFEYIPDATRNDPAAQNA
ncbi:amino acid permease-domain-containing protein [Cokeromyces recurvatus]|uniref:amino acid permease-domain-containing protein n=1 Tax=Cokeromyces recurvatus TaxID=90255 RepID=UPI00222105D7|nr:amino acid permease-domain-containing protein [Cokeromyces recurvatus]KAI7906485.1 amino acid permease-domain-containing protein [Cokeromyces recurvatus]